MRKKRKPPLNVWEAFEAFPPYYVRLLAKEPGNGAHTARSDAEIAIAFLKRAQLIAVLGSFTPGLSAAIFGSFHVLIVREKIPAMVSAESCRLFTLDRL